MYRGERLDMEVGFDNRQAAFDMVCTMLDSESGAKFCISVPKMTPAMNSVIRGIAMR